MNGRDELLIKEIVKYAEEIRITIENNGLTAASLRENFVWKNSISMDILQIGELVGKLSDELKQLHAEVPWRPIKAMRNIAAHHYGSFDIEILWETATEDIPQFEAFCRDLISNDQ